MSESAGGNAAAKPMGLTFHGSLIEAVDGPDGRVFVMDGKPYPTLGLAIMEARAKKDAAAIQAAKDAAVDQPAAAEQATEDQATLHVSPSIPHRPAVPVSPAVPAVPPVPTAPPAPNVPAKPGVTNVDSNEATDG